MKIKRFSEYLTEVYPVIHDDEPLWRKHVKKHFGDDVKFRWSGGHTEAHARWGTKVADYHHGEKIGIVYKDLNEEKQAGKLVSGTNCANCAATKGTKRAKVDPFDMDKQGGTIPANGEEKKRAKEGDLVTMPGSDMPTQKAWCEHPKIDQWVTERMCCAYWDAPGTLRSYGNQKLGT